MNLKPTAFTFTAGLLLLAGCGQSVSSADPAPTATGGSITVQNCDRDVVVDRPPAAVIGLHPAQTELLLRLGLADRLVGQAQVSAQPLSDDVAPLAADVPVIGGIMPPSREDLLAAEPDFVYSPTTYEFSAEQGFASIDQLEQAGADVYVATGGCQDRRMTGTVDDLFTDLDNLGRIFDVPDEAAELAADSKAELAEVTRALSGVEKLRTAEVYVEGTTLQVIGAGVEHDILNRAGADNVYGPDQPAFADFFAATVSPEALAAEQPEAIVFSAYDADHEASTRAYLTSTFPDLPAVRNGKLIAVNSADLFPGTLGNISTVRQIAENLYPQAF